MSGIALGILGICLVGGAIFAVFWARRNKRNMKAAYPGKNIKNSLKKNKYINKIIFSRPCPNNNSSR